MKSSTRVLIMGTIIEAGLLGLGAYLLLQISDGSLRPSVSLADTTKTITTVLGAAMGALGGLFLAMFLIFKSRGT